MMCAKNTRVYPDLLILCTEYWCSLFFLGHGVNSYLFIYLFIYLFVNPGIEFNTSIKQIQDSQ